MNRIQLSGDEVAPFLEIYNPLVEDAEKARKKNKKPNDIISVKMPVVRAANFVAFIQRAGLTGSEAAKFGSVINKAIESAKKAK